MGVLLGVKAGALLGVLFAQRSGKDLREKLKKSDNPFQTLLEEGWNIDKEIIREISSEVKNSESIQNIMQMGKEQFEDFVNASKDLSVKAKDGAIDRLHTIEKMAKESAKEIEKSAHKVAKDVEEKTKEVQKEVQKTARKFENELDTKIKAVKKKIS